MTDQSNPWVTLNSGELTASIDPLGAQLSVLRDREGRDLLWDGNPSVWKGRAPLLFPIVGELNGGRYRLGRTLHSLSRHGFARGKRFEVLEAAPTAATLRLTADEASLQLYPFHFELDMRFALHGSTLTLSAQLRNAGKAAMPASFGFHPALRWPLPFGRARAAHFIEFATDEPASVRRLDAQGLLTPERHPTPLNGRRLTLDDSLFQNDVIIFDAIRSRFVTYGADDGPRIRVSFPDTPYLGIWTKPQADFICIEPWHGIADPVGFSEDFTHKPGVFMVAPGDSRLIEMAIELQRA